MKKIYFVEKTIPFNSLDINEPFISGSAGVSAGFAVAMAIAL